jgi:hypothetical protein
MSKLKTAPASFTFQYADITPVIGNKLRLFNASTSHAFDLPLQYIKVCRLSTASVLEKRPDGTWYQHHNAAEHPVALIGGDMLHADTATFFVAYFGITTGSGHEGSSYRYNRFRGLAAAEAAVEYWSKRKYRVALESSVIDRIKAEVSKQAGFEIDTQVEPLGTGQDFTVSVAGEIRKTFANLRHTPALTFLLAGYNPETDRTAMTVNVKSFAAL